MKYEQFKFPSADEVFILTSYLFINRKAPLLLIILTSTSAKFLIRLKENVKEYSERVYFDNEF